MPKRPHSWFNTGLRFCGSCCITLTCWTAWIVLSVLLAALLYIAVAKELPVPGFVLRRAEAELARSGLALTFGRARFDPTGKVLLENVQLHAKLFDDPLLTCRLLYVRHSFWSMLSGWTFPEEIRLEGADLRLPAMLSPSGMSEPVMRDLAVALRHEDHLWHLDQFAGRMGRLRLTIQGDLATPAGSAGAAVPLDQLSARFLQLARQVAPVVRRFEAFDDPALAVRLETGPARGNTATLVFTAAGVRQPWDQPVTSGPLLAGASLPLDRQGLRPVQVHLAARQVNFRGEVVTDNLRAVVNAEVLPESFSGRVLGVLAAAGSLDLGEGLAIGPVLRADVSAWPAVRTTVAAQIDGEFLAAGIEASLTEQSARIHGEGRVSPLLITRVLARHTPRAEPYFRFGDPVTFQADAVLAPGWRFQSVSGRVDAMRLDSRGVRITAARGRIDIAGMSFLAHDARVTLDGSHARGSYWMDFATSDYRMLLDGALHPAEINGWFRGDWWLAFWNRYFAFAPALPPTAEVDVQGRWKDPALSNNFVQAHAESATIWGGDFAAVDATVFVRPGFAHGLALAGTRAGGTQWLKGSFKRFGAPAGHDTARFEFDFDTNADPAVMGRMLDGKADDVLATLRFTQPPRVHAWGALAGTDGTLVPDYHFTGEVGTSLHYFGFPLDALTVRGDVKGNEVLLGDIQFSTAGGRGAGKASLTGPAGARRLGFDVSVNKVNLARAIRAVQEYDAARTGRKPAATAESKFIQHASNSQLDVALSAQGDPASVASFRGSGNAALTGGELGEIHLFGLLSQVLNSLSLSFSSLKLDAARTSFTLENGELLFPDLKVTGPSALIDARGKYTLASNNLDFTARFKPYEAPGSLLAAAVSLVINPLTSILELKLGGQLADPKWSVVVGSSANPAKPSAPAVPPPPGPAPGPDKNPPAAR